MSKKEFLQLPPLLKEFGLEEVSMIWLFAKMSEGDKEKNLAFLNDILTDNPADSGVDLEHIDRSSVEEADELTRKFSDYMGKLIVRIMRLMSSWIDTSCLQILFLSHYRYHSSPPCKSAGMSAHR